MLARLQTSRLCLRARAREDIDAILSMDLDPEVFQYSEMRRDESIFGVAALRKGIRHQIRSQSPKHFWAIERLGQPGLLGLVGFSPGQLGENVLSYRLARSAWDQGIATEAVRQILGYGFGVLKLPLIVAFVHRDNERSHRVLDKIGLKPHGIAVLAQRSILNVARADDPKGSFLNINSQLGDPYLSYGMDREVYLSKVAISSAGALDKTANNGLG
jgi:RimJ/RimL family protein N-acetyltransferase